MTSADIFARPIAHRGLHDRAAGIIENSRSAFAAAIDRGFGIECDLQVSSDGDPVVFHDATLERLTGREGRVIDTKTEDLCATPLLESTAGDTPLRFPDLLDGVAGQVPLIVEIKQQNYPDETRHLTQQALKAVAGYEGPLVFKSFDPLALNVLHKAGYRGGKGIITFDYQNHADHLGGAQKFILRNTLHRAISHFTFISCEHTALSNPVVRLRRAMGMKVMSWTVRSAAQAQEALKHADQIVFEGFDPEA